MSSDVGCVACGEPARIYHWEKFSVASCVRHLKDFYNTSFSYPRKEGGQGLGGGLDQYIMEQEFSDDEMATLAYLLSFWSSLPELEGR